MSRLCPSDVYKVYKRGSNVRIDTTLLNFDHTSWQRGDRSYIFKGDGKFHQMFSKQKRIICLILQLNSRISNNDRNRS